LPKPLPVVEMDHIYTAYCYYKKFKKYFEIGQFLDSDRFLAYYQNNALVAWTKMRPYSQRAIETTLFVWDYSNPETKLGTCSLQHEIAWAKSQGYEYVYLGPGYQRSSLYKADIQGFEWWTGSEWSKDTKLYTSLCARDSKIKDLNPRLYDI
jgi:arginyl-tRNA--protein-N-Asp/Glu arginylyltransferase